MNPTVSLVLSYYNEKESWLRQCINSILNQTFTDYEIIIIIDNPTIERKINDYLLNLEDMFDNIHVIKNDVNIGLALSLNKGIKVAKGKYIARMDADDICRSDRLEKELLFLKMGNYDMVFSNKNVIGEDSQLIDTAKPYMFGNENINNILTLYNCVVHPSVLIRKEVILKLGGYRDFKQAQDYDLWLRLLSNNYKIGVLDEPLIDYRIRENSISQSKALLQFLTAEYQKKLFKQRMRKNVDDFSKENFNKFLLKNKAYSKQHNANYLLSCELLNKGLKQLKEKNIGGLFIVVISIMKEKNMLKRLLITIRYRIEVNKKSC